MSKVEWRISQQRNMNRLGVREQPGGGSRPAYPGDGAGDGVLAENKWTGREYITLHVAWLKKVFLEAARRGDRPVLTFELAGYGSWQMWPVWAWEGALPEEVLIPWSRPEAKQLKVYGSTLEQFKGPFRVRIRGDEWVCSRLD